MKEEKRPSFKKKQKGAAKISNKSVLALEENFGSDNDELFLDAVDDFIPTE